MRVTQFDIAKFAKVSQATVSRVLSGDDRVETELRDRVLETMREHNYQPDVRARSLRTRRTGLIGLVLQRPPGGLAEDPFFAALSAGIMDFLYGRPYHLCIDVVADDRSQAGIYDEMLRTRRVDGLILVEPRASDARVAMLQRDQFPFVIIGDPKHDSIASVDNDNVQAGYMATKHLIDQDYRQIGILGGPPRVNFSDDRVRGYVNAMCDAGRTPHVWHSEFGYEAARFASLEIFDSSQRPDAMVVLDDFMAFGVVASARERFLRIPDHLGLVSFNNTNLCNLMEGGMSSVSLQIERMVERAVSKLLEIIEGEIESPVREIIPCELVVRASSHRLEVAA
jgi:DNA-binding LacI/PurR family transcriptional regulator